MKYFLLSISLFTGYNFGFAQEAEINSPDEAVKVEVYLESGKPTYSVLYNDEVVLEKSRLGLKTNITDYSEGLNFEGSETNSVEKTYDSRKLKKSEINYNAQE